MKLTKRNLLRAENLQEDGRVMTITVFRKSEGQFADFDLVLKDGSKSEVVLLQNQSFNINSLIDLFGDDSDKWTGKKVLVKPCTWHDMLVIRFFQA
jgi:hypothetical protein